MWADIIMYLIFLIIFILILYHNHHKKEPTQRTFLYCGCGNELISSKSFISDTGEGSENHVLFKCKKCGKDLDFNFDIALVPIKWEDLRKEKDMK